MKGRLILPAVLFSVNSYACFSGVGYEENWNESINLLFIALAIGVLSTLIRFCRKSKHLLIPAVILMVSCVPSAIEMIRYGNGDCGSGLVKVAVWPVYIMSVAVFYEAAKLVKVKLGVGNT